MHYTRDSKCESSLKFWESSIRVFMISNAFSLKEISGVSIELLVLEGRLATEEPLDGVKTSAVMTATKFGSITSAERVSLPS